MCKNGKIGFHHRSRIRNIQLLVDPLAEGCGI